MITYTEAQNALILAGELSNAVLAKRFGICKRSVQRQRAKLEPGKGQRGARLKLSDEEVRQTVDLRAWGMRPGRIAYLYGVHPATLRNRMKDLGVQVQSLRGVGRPRDLTEDMIETAIELKTGNYTWAQVSRVMGFDARHIQLRVHERRKQHEQSA